MARNDILSLQNELKMKANNTLLWILGGAGVAGFVLSAVQFFI